MIVYSIIVLQNIIPQLSYPTITIIKTISHHITIIISVTLIINDC